MHEISRHLQQLNLATRHYHADVDRPWLGLLLPTVSKADYCAVLVRMYGFIAPCESAASYTPGLSRLLDARARAGLIAQDLLTLGLSPAQVSSVPHCASITTFDSPAEALGWLYVIERSTLLHEGIRRHLLAQLRDIERACTYLSAHDGRGWTAFGQTLDKAAMHDLESHALVAGAIRGFETLGSWFRASDARRITG